MDFEKSDDDLAVQARAGSRAAMETLYRRYRERILTFAFRMTGDRSLAEDVFQNTFLYFFEHLGRYDPQGKLAAYLFRIARSLALDAVKAGRRERRILGRLEPVEVPAEEAPPTDRVQKALLDLEPHLREVITLRLTDGLDYARIGEIVGVSEATARSRMRYALEALREAMKARGNP
jgi:RNA polymerase sigma-70 factor (ECF subfamily)